MTGNYSNTHKELVERCKNGDSRAQYELYKNYSKAMFNICYRMMNSREEAEDIAGEVFLKALTVVRNLGHKVTEFTTANFDFIRHYRPMTNVVRRPTMDGGAGFHITGHHEIMFPLLAAAVIERMES